MHNALGLEKLPRGCFNRYKKGLGRPSVWFGLPTECKMRVVESYRMDLEGRLFHQLKKSGMAWAMGVCGVASWVTAAVLS